MRGLHRTSSYTPVAEILGYDQIYIAFVLVIVLVYIGYFLSTVF